MSPLTKKGEESKYEGKELFLDNFTIPKRYLNSMGFINYDHFGDFPWKKTAEEILVPPELTRITQFLAIDCEMVGISEEFDDRELARVSVVNEFGYCLLDTFAKPTVPVVSYHTKYSGIRAEYLENAPSVDKVREDVLKLVKGKVLVGHSIHHDLDVLNLQNYPTNLLRDTADFYKFRFIPGRARTPALKHLAWKFLNAEIQNGDKGHFSIQDAQATIKLYLIHRDLWERELKESIQKTTAFGYTYVNGTTAQTDIAGMNIDPEKKDLLIDSRTIYLRPNKILGGYESSKDYIDCQFRLLLEDFLRPLRDGVQVVRYKNRQKYRIDRLYEGVSVQLFDNEGKKSKAIYGNVKVPIDFNKLRNIDWNMSKMFIKGSLVVLSADNFSSVHFAIVESLSEESTLPSSHLLFIRVAFCKTSDKISIQNKKFYMMESKAFFEAYKHTLEYFQKMDLDAFPLKKYIVDVQTHPVQPMRLVKKVYDERKMVDFGVLMKNDNHNRVFNPFNEHQWPSKDALGLDESQHLALKHAITQELSIIQGPPGCGKTFIGVQIIKLLLTNPWMLDDTPIMIVSYTNHALDQTLERVFRFYSDHFCKGNDREASLGMIRLGGRSESEQIKELTLFHKTNQKKIYSKTNKLVQEAQVKLQGLLFLKQLLREDPTLLRSGILDISNWKTWMTVNHMENIKKRFRRFSIPQGYGIDLFTSESFKKNPAATLGVSGMCTFTKRSNFLIPSKSIRTILFKRFGIQGNDVKDLLSSMQGVCNSMSFSKEDKHFQTVWICYFAFVICIDQYIAELDDNVYALKKKLAAIGPVKTASEHIKCAKIIGMTTTGAVKNKEMILNKFKPRVMLVEEAAHVLEAHVVASLTEHCDQMILIGDHKQLRPLTADNSLSWRYKLDVSLMERLVRNGIHQGRRNWVQLKIQHRMRPEIARMVCPLIYKELDNHPDVQKYENVKGCRKNLFFIDHQFPEEKEDGSASYHNMYELRVVKALARFFVDNGYYSPSRITIIAAYKAQRDLIETQFMESKNSDLENIRVSTVDGFQGEESDIVILSLVRSNNEEVIGFLRTNNRLCVALSRARHGFFMTGNMTCLAGAAENWETLYGVLKQMNAIGTAGDLPLYGNNEKILKNLKQPPIPKVLPERSFPVDELSLRMDNLSINVGSSCGSGLPITTFSRPVEDLHLPKAQISSPQVSEDISRSLTPSPKPKCNHKIPNDTCKVVVQVMDHSICGHKVVVKCCDQNRRSSLWCDKNIVLTCHSCNWIKQNKSIKCRTMLMGNHYCQKCKTKIQLPTQLTKPVAKVEQILPKAEILALKPSPIKSKSPQKKQECSKIFKCGHHCRFDAQQEHSKLHISNYQCIAPCNRTCAKGHKCPKSHKCFTFCPLTSPRYGCQEPVHDYMFSCGHPTGETLKCAQVSKNSLKKLLVKKRCKQCDS